jgi:hypothetical protein
MGDTDCTYDRDMIEADPVFKKACEEFNEKGFSSTLLKDVLKSKIQLRRVSTGQEELRVEKRTYIKHPVRNSIYCFSIICMDNINFIKVNCSKSSW